MKFSNVFLLCGQLAISVALTRGQGPASIAGYVTRAVSASDFDVNGFHILCTALTGAASTSVQREAGTTVACPGDPPFVGEYLTVYYTLRLTAAHSIYALRIEKQPTPKSGEVSGSAVIDAAPVQEAAGAPDSGLLVRADGYRIRITGTTEVTWLPPLQSLAGVETGDWIEYKGKLDAAGVLVAASVKIGPNMIGSGEEKLRADGEYDPTAVPAGARQNYMKNAFRGGYTGQAWDPKKFPPFRNAEMQTRVEKIGNSLVPAYQRALPDSAPAKINFRFQVIDNKRLCGLIPCDALAQPNGIILIPHQLVERTQNDSQLAAVLADAMARALERQQYREEKKKRTANAAVLAGFILLPYGGGSIVGEGSSAEEQILLHEHNKVAASA